MIRFKAKTRKEAVDGLSHVMRWLSGAEHEDDCQMRDTVGMMCDCGKVLAYEQAASAREMLKAKAATEGE